MGLSFRPYQERAIADVRRSIATGKRRALIVAPTGSGKTVIASRIIMGALEQGRRVLFLAHRRELIKQPFCKLVRYGVPESEIGIIMAGVGLEHHSLLPKVLGPDATDTALWTALAKRRPDAPVQIASVDSLRNREVPDADLVIIDEAHRTLAASYMAILEKLPEAVVIGLTATPSRGDGRGLGEFYQALVLVATYGELVAEGFLVAPRVWTVPVLPDLSRVRVVAGEYDHEQLANVVNQEGLIGDIVEHYRLHGQDAPALAFGASVEHSQRIAERFNGRGIPAAHVDCDMSTDARDDAFEGLATGRYRVVCNYDVASEGTDIPCVKTVISARPTKSLRVWLQQCGRGSRPFEGRPFQVLDHAGNATVHGLPQDDREWSLDGRKRQAGERGPAAWTCPGCLAVNPLNLRECPACQSVREIAERAPPAEHDGKLVEAKPLDDAAKAQGWDAIVKQWRADNATRACPRKPGWCLFQFRERFGCVPPRGCVLPRWTDDEAQRRDRFDKLKAEAERKGYDPRYPHVKLKPPSGDDFEAPVTTTW